MLLWRAGPVTPASGGRWGGPQQACADRAAAAMLPCYCMLACLQVLRWRCLLSCQRSHSLLAGGPSQSRPCCCPQVSAWLAGRRGGAVRLHQQLHAALCECTHRCVCVCVCGGT
jgi:hypothetical protein